MSGNKNHRGYVCVRNREVEIFVPWVLVGRQEGGVQAFQPKPSKTMGQLELNVTFHNILICW